MTTTNAAATRFVLSTPGVWELTTEGGRTVLCHVTTRERVEPVRPAPARATPRTGPRPVLRVVGRD